MGWKETALMDRRGKFMAQYQQGEVSFALLCRQFGVSRTTGCKWVERHQREGADGRKERP